ncbi:MAG: hypothetical protein K8H84_01605 [Sulfuricella denitrificans]|nr:hypothetical protein [Sulfuricella denitrificans]
MKPFSTITVFGVWMLAASPGWADEALGRLFYTQEQRVRMDAARQHERSIRIDEEESTPPPVNIQLNGVITRSDGRSTVWINNKVHSADQALPGVVVDGRSGRSGEVGVAVPGVRGNVSLKVGQSIDVTSGQVEEVYRRPSPAPLPESPRPLATEKHAKPPGGKADQDGSADTGPVNESTAAPPTR